MASEREFLCQRLAMVERTLVNSDCPFVPAGRGRVRRRTGPDSRRDLTYKREARQLCKLQAQTRDGQVLTTMRAWRRQLGQFLMDHRQRYKRMQDTYDAWWHLPRDVRKTVRRPPRPPSARYIDRNDSPWIIDDRFLALLDDLIQWLEK